MHNEHPRTGSIGKRRLGNLPGRKVKMEVFKTQPATIAQVRGIRILGIESSCDETAAAVVEDACRVISSSIASQMDVHGKYGGVVPELASREHLRAIVPVTREALAAAGGISTIDAIAVTEGPGLIGSLLVGITYAKALSLAHNLPLIAVNHIEGHIHAVVLETRMAGGEVEFPAVALIASGGHTHLYQVSEDFHYKLLGRTRDDAAGEAFDKVAKLLGFGYPGGPVIDALAAHGDARSVRFSLVKMKGNALDFSFSGLKTAVLRWVEERDLTVEIAIRKERLKLGPVTTDEWLALTTPETLGMLASFQATVVEELLRRAEMAVDQTNARALIVSGGVACNQGLRSSAAKAGLACEVHFPAPALSTDNAVMIAAAAFPKLAKREWATWDLKAKANLALA
jgi:N6-L-threonylcarbamoyladenine synthase